ncbi:hypothetical protein [Aureibacter tunicatorum]|uniref:Uncharacterized protein n=1 Tax=Aureibacter tunicatorum TaxID=866807 RepID=A0AAE3XP58_9BACT|nr:hypothetical protein [Aureibacter tunicatorum]MDR6239489.1 hypothetical protein [Aureibacter tunicatorum]BDD04590.1 hypothetical protein AUTU_20730 [Aureibacter tunicatorum]
MSRPTKKKNFRKIVIGKDVFLWKFDEIIIIYPIENKNNCLKVEFGWHDRWLHINDQENMPNKHDPKVVTPSFVKEAIKAAFDLKWDFRAKASIFLMKYDDGKFSVI